MNILIFGAAGQVGRLTAAAALQASHSITATERHIDVLKPLAGEGQLRIHQCDVTKPSEVANALDSASSSEPIDAVVCTFGAPVNKGPSCRRQISAIVASRR